MNCSVCLPGRRPLSLAISAALGALISLPALAQSPEYDDDELILEEVVVTGSRIERTVNTQSQEVVIFTAEDIVSSGDISVAEVLRSSTLNSFGSSSDIPLDGGQSTAQLDLRGVGSDRNLVVLNGRRTVGSPALDGSGAVNLNMIPFSAVDRIEIIADGASAVYGSDAVAGVTNIILKKNYEGLTFRARYGDRSEDDGTEESAAVLIGASNDRGNITFSLEYDKRDPIYDADRDYLRPKWGDFDGDGVIMGYVETHGVSYYGYTLFNPSYDPEIPYDPADPATWPLTPGADCSESGGFTGAISFEAVFGPDTGFYCGYAYGLVATSRAGLERINTWVSADYQLTDSVELLSLIHI